MVPKSYNDDKIATKTASQITPETTSESDEIYQKCQKKDIYLHTKNAANY